MEHAAPNDDTAGGIWHVELVDRLWKLKYRYQSHAGGFIHLKLLINDADYRNSVLDKAARSGVDELSIMSMELRQLLRQHGDAQKPSRRPPPVLPASETQPRRWITHAVAALVVLVSLAVSLVIFGARSVVSDTASGAANTSGTAVASAVTRSSPSEPPSLPNTLPEPALRLHGSNTVGEQLAPALLEGLLRKRGYTDIRIVGSRDGVEKSVYAFAAPPLPEIAVEIHAHGSSTAFRDLLMREADMGMSSRPIKAGEVAELIPMAGNLTGDAGEHVIALDGLAVIVHAANPLSQLTTAQVAQLFSGQIDDWVQLGGNPGPIAIYARDDHSGTFDTFKSLVLSPHNARLATMAQRFESSSELADRVADDPNGIGFIGLPYVRRAKLLAISETAEALAILPTHFTVGTEDYPLSRRLYFYTPPNGNEPLARELADFALSQEGQDIVEKLGFVSQNIRTEKPRPDGSFPADYLTLTKGAQRLSLNFRFHSGSDALDNKSRRDLERLVGYLADKRDRQLMLFGFTDGTGDPVRNQLLSERRADQVEQALQARGLFPQYTGGFGQAIPLASDTTPAGRNKNRRVEVWLR